MPFYEVIFEVGEHSVMFDDDDEKVRAAVEIQHQRAKSGLPNGPAGDRADRIVRVLKYDTHPGDVSTTLPEKDAKAHLAAALEAATSADGKVDLTVLASKVELRAIIDTPAHDSNYALKEVGELEPTTWGGEAV